MPRSRLRQVSPRKTRKIVMGGTNTNIKRRKTKLKKATRSTIRK
jgi:hypothetical protein